MEISEGITSYQEASQILQRRVLPWYITDPMMSSYNLVLVLSKMTAAKG